MHLSSNVLIGEDRLRQRVEAMAAAIAADTPAGDRVTVLALMNGAFMFCADVVRRLPMPVHLCFLPVVSLARGGSPDQFELPPEVPIRGADVLVVEDILDTGRTLEALRSHLEALHPARIRMAVLLDKPARREARIRPEYVGFTVGDRWVVGYGLDYEGLYRNLPYVSYMEGG